MIVRQAFDPVLTLGEEADNPELSHAARPERKCLEHDGLADRKLVVHCLSFGAISHGLFLLLIAPTAAAPWARLRSLASTSVVKRRIKSLGGGEIPGRLLT
jgi:hypothetical protein